MEMLAPEVSIVIPVYKPDRYLYQVLQSVREQTYKNYEVVISDDTPETGSAKNILCHFSDLPVRYVRNEAERGIFSNLNNAIMHSTGSFVQIFCQDDVMKNDFLEQQLRTFNTYPTAGLVFCGLEEIDEEGKVFNSIPYFTEPPKSWKAFLPKAKAYNYLFAYGCIPRNLSPVMLRRGVIEKVGLFNQAYPFAGDYEYWIRVARQYDFAYNKEPLLYVRTHSERASVTIGLLQLIPEAARLHSELYNDNTVSASKRQQFLQINNLMVTHFKGVVKMIFSGKLQYLTMLRYFQVAPFDISTILFITLQRMYKRKITWFISEAEC